jgi:hypothetical protein
MSAPGQTPLFELGDGMCQRWRGRRHSWQSSHPAGVFDARGHDVRALADDTTPKAYIEAHHYSGSYVSALHRFGLFRSGELVGVAVYSTPGGGDKVLTTVFPELRPSVEAVELGRLVLAEEVPGNAETWFLARCHELLVAAGVVGVVSFSDPVPRRLPDGTLVMPGHVGIIYQASNAFYAHRGTARSLWVLPDGTVMNGVALQKIRDQDTGHEYAERTLMRWGMRPMRAGEDPRKWLQQAKNACRVRTYRHPGNHRYAFVLGADVCVIGHDGVTLRRPAKKVRRKARAAGEQMRTVRIAKPVTARHPKRPEARELVAA